MVAVEAPIARGVLRPDSHGSDARFIDVVREGIFTLRRRAGRFSQNTAEYTRTALGLPELSLEERIQRFEVKPDWKAMSSGMWQMHQALAQQKFDIQVWVGGSTGKMRKVGVSKIQGVTVFVRELKKVYESVVRSESVLVHSDNGDRHLLESVVLDTSDLLLMGHTIYGALLVAQALPVQTPTSEASVNGLTQLLSRISESMVNMQNGRAIDE